jgi:hypothetical protein
MRRRELKKRNEEGQLSGVALFVSARTAESGGEMATNKLDQKTEKPKRGRGRPRKEPRDQGGKEKTEEKKDGLGDQIEDQNNDAEGQKPEKAKKALRKAVKKQIRAQSDAIALALVNKVANGDKRCTEMMFSLIEKKKKDDDGAGRNGGLTTADLLGSEEQWEDETCEALENKSELGMGGREPENHASEVRDQGSGRDS